jgi:uncharacterized OsmC-like protein
MQNDPLTDNTRLEGSADEAIARTLIDSFTTELSIATHAFVADEPAAAGGNGLGPSPYDLLSAALASCTSMTLRMYATRKSWPMKSATVRVRHQKAHIKDCLDCESDRSHVDEFRREIELEGDLTDEQRRRLLDIAEKCPVHRTLGSEIRITTALAPGNG